MDVQQGSQLRRHRLVETQVPLFCSSMDQVQKKPFPLKWTRSRFSVCICCFIHFYSCSAPSSAFRLLTICPSERLQEISSRQTAKQQSHRRSAKSKHTRKISKIAENDRAKILQWWKREEITVLGFLKNKSRLTGFTFKRFSKKMKTVLGFLRKYFKIITNRQC